MTVSIIAALAQNRVIGKDNDLVWSYPKDMHFFKDKTKNHIVVMGRKNYDSIPLKYRPLPHRTNVVVTKQIGFKAEGCLVLESIEKAIDFGRNNNEKEIFIIGGGQIYEYALSNNLVDKMYLTFLDKEYDGDVFFPDFEPGAWEEINRESHLKDEKHEADFHFVTFVKKDLSNKKKKENIDLKVVDFEKN